MSDKFCWNCSHSFEHHRHIEGICNFFSDEEGACGCTQYEDAEYLGHQRKRDLYTLSDRRRLSARRADRK